MNKIIKYFLVVILLFISYQINILSQPVIKAEFEAADGKIFIYYEFLGDEEAEYEVKAVLKRTNDPNFILVPAVLQGDVGRGSFANSKRTIVWHLNPQEESKLDGDDFYFDISAKKIDEGGGIPWYIYVGGTALAGGAAAFLLLNKKDTGGDDDGGGGTVTFPNPPGRP